MRSTTFTFKDREDQSVFVYKWEPDGQEVRGCLQISHGLAEHAGRYALFAEYFTRAGFICYANDHRGHGQTAGGVSRRGILGPGGWDAVVRDLKALTDIVRKENSGKPVFLIGHSLGSMLAQDYIQRFGSEIRGVILSGSNGGQSFVVQNFGTLLSRLMVGWHGADAPSDLAYKLTFKAYNKSFLPSPTGTDFDWLNRDPDKVRAYAADPWCGFRISNGAALELAMALKRIWRPERERQIPAALPILIVAGEHDSTSLFLKSLKPLANRYERTLGIRDVTAKYYPGARHEIFNETNRDEVLGDVLAWIEARMKRPAPAADGDRAAS